MPQSLISLRWSEWDYKYAWIEDCGRTVLILFNFFIVWLAVFPLWPKNDLANSVSLKLLLEYKQSSLRSAIFVGIFELCNEEFQILNLPCQNKETFGYSQRSSAVESSVTCLNMSTVLQVSARISDFV